MADQEGEDYPEECPGDALVPPHPLLEPDVAAVLEVGHSGLEVAVDLAGRVDQDHGGDDAHHHSVHSEGVPVDVRLAVAQARGLMSDIGEEEKSSD